MFQNCDLEDLDQGHEVQHATMGNITRYESYTRAFLARTYRLQDVLIEKVTLEHFSLELTVFKMFSFRKLHSSISR